VPKIKGKEVEAEEVEFGVRFDDGFIVLCNDDTEAETLGAMTGGKILVRDVYITEWAELAE
jgi:hypothetical protein